MFSVPSIRRVRRNLACRVIPEVSMDVTKFSGAEWLRRDFTFRWRTIGLTVNYRR